MENNPYTIIRSAWSTAYFSNTGIRIAKTSSFGEPPYNTGKLGLPIDEHDASQFIIPLEQEAPYYIGAMQTTNYIASIPILDIHLL